MLQTGTQIKNRLYDSLAKFQEYEDALDSIIRNLESLEPQIKESVATPVEELEDLQKEYDNFKVGVVNVAIRDTAKYSIYLHIFFAEYS